MIDLEAILYILNMTEQAPIKYLFKPDPYSSHSIILTWLENMPEGSKILDVGTATGYIGKMTQYKKFELYGLEPELEWLEKARPFYKDIQCCNLESADLTYLENYQVILLADVLEHMARPEKELKRLVSIQPKGAIFIISVPNIANIWVRSQLLFGNFEYTDRGLLDKTHLRFFTRKSFVRFLNDQGLHIINLKATPIPLGLVHPFFVNTWLGKKFTSILAAMTRLWPTLLGYQWVAKCEVNHNG